MPSSATAGALPRAFSQPPAAERERYPAMDLREAAVNITEGMRLHLNPECVMRASTSWRASRLYACASLCRRNPAILMVALACDGGSVSEADAILRPGVYPLATVNGAPVPTPLPGDPTRSITSGELGVTAPDMVTFEEVIESSGVPTQVTIQSGTFRARIQGSQLTLEPIVATRSLTGTLRGDTVQLAFSVFGGPAAVTHVYVRR